MMPATGRPFARSGCDRSADRGARDGGSSERNLADEAPAGLRDDVIFGELLAGLDSTTRIAVKPWPHRLQRTFFPSYWSGTVSIS
jgi:hypothetical protein